MDRNEELLILKAQQGNLHAFGQLVQLHDDKVMAMILNMIQDTEDARDLYQDVFLKVFKSIDKFRFQSEFFTWVCRIAINCCIDFRRKRRSHIQDSLDEESWTIVHRSDEKDPEQRYLNDELNEQIQKGIAALSPRQRAVFTLKHDHGYKLNQIADIMQCSEGTVKSYLFRATHKLRDSLRLYW